jgi:AraC-like DNA-binding protein
VASKLLLYLQSVRLTFERSWQHAVKGYCAFHKHPAFEIVYHLTSAGRTTDDRGKTVQFRPHSVVTYPPNAAHDQQCRISGEEICIHVGASELPPPALNATFYVQPVSDTRLRTEMMALAQLPPSIPALHKLACHHRAAAVLTRLVELAGITDGQEEANGADRCATAAREYVREHFMSVHSMSDAAAGLGIGYDHLRHIFQRRYGMSLKRWHVEVKIERAKDLLAHTHLPLKAIAELCAFENERYFSTCFRRIAGCTPGAFRAKS